MLVREWGVRRPSRLPHRWCCDRWVGTGKHVNVQEAATEIRAGCHVSAQGACSRGHLPSHAGLQGGARALGASHIPGQCLEPQRPAKSSFSRSSRSFLEAMRAFKELASGGTRKAAERCGPDTAGPAAQRGAAWHTWALLSIQLGPVSFCEQLPF